jgi:hypothetical protein
MQTKMSSWNESLDRAFVADNPYLQRFVRCYHHFILTLFTKNYTQSAFLQLPEKALFRAVFNPIVA